MIHCVLVVNGDRFGLKAIRAAIDSGFILSEIWTGDTRFPGLASAPIVTPLSSSIRRRIARALRQSGAHVRHIGKPRLAALETALNEAPRMDVLICAGSSIIFPERFLARLGGRAVNLHPSLLPHYKGPFPIHAQMIDGTGDRYGGMTLHVLEAGIDAGPIIGQRKMAVSDYASPGEWVQAVLGSMRDLMAEELVRYLDGNLKPMPQPQGAGSYFSAEDVRFDGGPGQSFKQIQRYMQVSPHMQTWAKALLPVGARKRAFVVTGKVMRLGPPTGDAPVVGLRFIEFDATDARVRLKRLTKPERLLAKIRRKLSRLGRVASPR
jgi:methionyl-tRNA formyltransferase